MSITSPESRYWIVQPHSQQQHHFCKDCGALVFDPMKHDAFHDMLLRLLSAQIPVGGEDSE